MPNQDFEFVLPELPEEKIKLRRRSRRELARDYVIYLAICLALIVPLVVSLVTDFHYDVILFVFGGVSSLAVIFVGVVEKNPSLLKQPSFWILLLLTLPVHAAALWAIHHSGSQKNRTYYWLLFVVEGAIVWGIVDRLLERSTT